MLSNLFRRPASPGKNDRNAARRSRLGVSPLEDRCVPATIVVTSAGDTIAPDGLVTLREAITAANTNQAAGDAPAGTSGLDIINFAIGSGQQTINLVSALPALTERVTINGSTQPGFAGKPIIQLVAAPGVGTTGIALLGSNSTVRGLLLNKFRVGISVQGNGGHIVSGNYIGTTFDGMSLVPPIPGGTAGVTVYSTKNIIGVGAGDGNLIAGQGYGILFEAGGSFNQVKGNLIGTDATGTNRLGNGTGVHMRFRANSNRIGGTDEGDGQNVISGNGAGVGIVGSRNVILANLIGTDPSGTIKVANAIGVQIGVGSLNVIGGAGPGAGNVISGNTLHGIDLNAVRTTVQGNRIGTDIFGAPMGNGGHGVAIYSSNNLIGGSLATAGNTIHYNGLNGVAINDGSGNAIRRNSFLGNGDLAIHLATTEEGPTVNDDLDKDAGANGLQNFPTLVWAANNYVEGVLNSRKNRTYIIDLYSSPAAPNPESGQGTTHLRSFTVKTDAQGDAAFTTYLSQGVPVGTFLTATATTIANAPYGDTSEFSPVVQMEGFGGGSLTAASMAPSPSVAKLTAASAQSLLGEAIRRWQDSGVDTSAIQGISIRVTDLGSNTLGHAGRNTIWLDDNAAGWGWFVDRSPRNDSEFRARGNQGEQKRMDLLSVLMHEVGHLLGREHVASTLSAPHDVMSETLTAGTRWGIA